MQKQLHVQYTLKSVHDRSQWEQFFVSDTTPSGHVLQTWEWGNIKASSGWSPVRLALVSGEKVIAGAQVLRCTAPHVPLRLGHIAYIPKGPMIDWSQPEQVQIFFAQLHPFLSRQGAIALRLDIPHDEATVEGKLVGEQLRRLGFTAIHPVQPLRTIILDLAPEESMLLAQMKPKWRYNVRLAERKGVQVRQAQTLADVDAWYHLYEITAKRDNFGIHSLDYYRMVWQELKQKDRLVLLLAEYEGRLLAGIMATCVGDEALYLYGASDNEERHLMPNYALQWQAICWARQQGAKRYDFWGIPDTDEENEEMAGVYRFKAGWGGKIVRFVSGFEYVYQSLLMKLVQRWL